MSPDPVECSRAAVAAAALVGACLALPLGAAANPEAAATALDLFELGAPTFTTFTSRDGLPESVLVAVETDADGFVWASSPAGLSRYDGQRWREPPAAGFARGAIADLVRDRAGTLWASFRERGLAALAGGVWRTENLASGLPSQRIRRILELPAAAARAGAAGDATELWMLTIDGHLLRRTGGGWIVEPGSEALPTGPLLAAARTRRIGGGERLWVGTYNEGVWYRDEGSAGGAWKPLKNGRFDPSQIEFLLATESAGRESLWISTFGSGLWRYDERGFREWSVASGELPGDELYGLAETRLPTGAPVIWAASRSGLVRIYADRAQLFDRRHGLPSDAVRGLSAWRSPDGYDVLWVATEAGLARTVVGASPWMTASLMGVGGSGVFGVLVEPDGHGGERLWLAASRDGVALYEHGAWRRFSAADGTLPDGDARRIVRLEDGDGGSTLWLGLRQGHLLRIEEGPKFIAEPTPWERHPGQAVLDLLRRELDGHEELWVATRQSGIYRRRGGVWTAFRPEGAAGQWHVRRIVEQDERDGASGRSWLWAATNLGLARFDGERWELVGPEAGLPAFELLGLALLPATDGRPILWAGSSGSGLLRIDVADPSSPRRLAGDDLPPAPDPVVYGAVRDSKGRIYLCSNNGVQQLTPVAGRWVAKLFTRRDGMVHEECNTNAQLIDSHDRFWTGTLGGLTVFDPDRAIANRQAKPLRLTGVTVDGEPVEVAPASALRVSPTVRELRVDFALLSWHREGESSFRTELRGHDTGPGEWTAQGSRSFGSLPAGSYTLRIEARDFAGNESPPIELPIVVLAAWWNGPLAWALFLVAAVGLVAALFAARTRGLRARQRRLEQEVAERTTELYAANARLLDLSYQDALTGLANRRRLLETLEASPGAAPGGARPAALVFVDVDHFKSYNDRFGHPAGDEALRCVARVLREQTPAGALVARYGGEEFASLLFATELDPAIAIAERIRAAVADCDIAVPGTETVNRITLSAGVAALPLLTPADPHRLLRDADMALYQAKRDGRNCVRASR